MNQLKNKRINKILHNIAITITTSSLICLLAVFWYSLWINTPTTKCIQESEPSKNQVNSVINI